MASSQFISVVRVPIRQREGSGHPRRTSQGFAFAQMASIRWLRHASSRSMIIVALLALWEVLPRFGLVERVFLPPFSEVLGAGIRLSASGQMVHHVEASLVRSLTGFCLAIAYAVPLGIAIGWYKPAANIINPIIEVLRNTAALALLPVFILFLGIGEVSKIALVVYACSWPILLNTIAGVRSVDPLLVKSARVLGASPLQVFRKVVLPASLPTIFVGIRLAGAVSVLVLVAAEMIGAKAGLGYLIIYSQYNFQVPQMYFGILCITLVGLVFNFTLIRLERYFVPWKDPPRNAKETLGA